MTCRKASLIAVMLGLLALPAFASIKQVAEKDKLTVTHYAANGAVVRVEITEKTGDSSYKTTVTDDAGKQIGYILHTVLQTRSDKDNFTYFYTRNEHYDANGSFVATSYSLFVVDPDGLLVNIINGRQLDDLLGLNVAGGGTGKAKASYGSITAGVDSGNPVD